MSATLIALTGLDRVNLVEYSIIFSIVILPLTYLPVLAIARNETVMGKFVNGLVANTLGWFYLIILCLAALSAVPLLIMTHGGKG